MSYGRIVDLNLTSNFGLPLAGFIREALEPYLVNAYIDDCSLDDEALSEPHIFVLLRYQGTPAFKELETMLEGKPNFYASYDISGGNFVMYVFRVLDDCQDDFKLFLKGKYSQISASGRHLILKSVKKNGVAEKILLKDKSLKTYQETVIGQSIGDQEVWSIPDSAEEVFSKAQLQLIINKFTEKGHVLS